ncbi:MAG: menaquinone biosynthesis protein [Syntrophomonadaceae bacterium]|nr:menaquinone biosynthesis protein [Syntrophomonadaceae bacterium]
MRPRVGHIQFINCLPLYYGLVKKDVLLDVELTKGTPTELNRMLIQGELDISPISSIEYGRHADLLLLMPDLTVSAEEEVLSILLLSKVPIEELEGRTIALTNTSATSHALLKILLKEKYGLNCNFFICPPELGSMLLEADAALLIGDHALRAYFHPRPDLFSYDLGKLWKELTGLPMVFAVWAIRREFAEKHPELAQEVYHSFFQSMQYSLENLSQIASNAARWETLEAHLLEQYFACLRFDFGEKKQEGLITFYTSAHKHNFLPKIPSLQFLNIPHSLA